MPLYMTVSIITSPHTDRLWLTLATQAAGAWQPAVCQGLAAGSRGLAAGRRRLMVAARAGAGRPRTGRQRGERQADGAW